MKKRILSLLLVLVFALCMLASCASVDSLDGETYKVSKISLKFNKDASTHEKYEFLQAVRILADDDSLTESKALNWTEKFVLDLCKNHTVVFKDGKVTESFGEMSSSMVKETNPEKIALKKSALHVLGNDIFNLTLTSNSGDAEAIPNYEVSIDANGVYVKRLGTKETVFLVSGYSRYIQFSVDSTHAQNNKDSFITQAYDKNDTLNVRSTGLKQTIENDGFVMKLTYKKK